MDLFPYILLKIMYQMPKHISFVLVLVWILANPQKSYKIEKKTYVEAMFKLQITYTFS